MLRFILLLLTLLAGFKVLLAQKDTMPLNLRLNYGGKYIGLLSEMRKFVRKNHIKVYHLDSFDRKGRIVSSGYAGNENTYRWIGPDTYYRIHQGNDFEGCGRGGYYVYYKNTEKVVRWRNLAGAVTAILVKHDSIHTNFKTVTRYKHAFSRQPVKTITYQDYEFEDDKPHTLTPDRITLYKYKQGQLYQVIGDLDFNDFEDNYSCERFLQSLPDTFTSVCGVAGWYKTVFQKKQPTAQFTQLLYNSITGRTTIIKFRSGSVPDTEPLILAVANEFVFHPNILTWEKGRTTCNYNVYHWSLDGIVNEKQWVQFYDLKSKK